MVRSRQGHETKAQARQLQGRVTVDARAIVTHEGKRIVFGDLKSMEDPVKSHRAFRAAKAIVKTRLVLTPTNSPRTSFTELARGRGVKTADHQLESHLGGVFDVKKTSGSIHMPRVHVVIAKEAACQPIRS